MDEAHVIRYDGSDPVHQALMELTQAVASANQVVNGTNIRNLNPSVLWIDWPTVLRELRERPKMGPALLDSFRVTTSRGMMGMEEATAADFGTADREVVASAVICMRTRRISQDLPEDASYAVAVLDDGMIITHNEPGTTQ